MDVKKLGMVLIPILFIYVIYDKAFANKELIPDIDRLKREEAVLEEAILERQFNKKKTKLLLENLNAMSGDFRLFDKSPASQVQSQIRRASNGKLKVFSFGGSSSQLKELNKSSEKDGVIYYLDTRVSAQNLSVRDIVKMLESLRKQRPRLVWQSLTINSNNPARISLNGSLRALFLSEDLSLALSGDQK